MRIQHNITALNAANRLKANESTVAKNIQKLSSGYRINSAADDAAGLAVSEKMRKQINGLSQAEDNTKNGISLIQTAEGGLNETSAILQRMNTLAVESANGTYKDEDRANLQKELDHLNTEIDRISTSTKFNEISLLDGSLGYSHNVTIGGTNALHVTGVTVQGGGSLSSSDGASLVANVTGTYTDSTKKLSLSFTSSLPTGVTFADVVNDGSQKSFTFRASVADTATAAVKAAWSGVSITVNTSQALAAGDDTKTVVFNDAVTGTGPALSFQVGAENVADQRASLTLGNMDSTTLGTKSINIGNQTGAQNAIDTIKAAIASVSTTRADLGALQNELEHTANNLGTMSENLTSAESTIRDVDMTDEYVQYSKNQILSQAANAMLAQANTQPQNVLSLLKG